MKRTNQFIAKTLLFFAAATVTVYADTTPNDFKYSIKINADTTTNRYIEVYNKDGERVLPKKVHFPKEPLPVDAIINVHTIIEAEGSCLLIIDGEVFNVC
jgi:hypothetical protein